jgi:hypothetical protein
MTRNVRFTCLIALIGLSGFVYACGSSSSGGGSGGAAGTSTGNNNNGNGGSSNNGGSNSNNGGSNTGNNGGSTSNGGAANNGGSSTCDPAADPTGMGNDCGPYNECMQESCATEYEGCMGANYQDGDFSGGTCENYMNCVVDCDCDDACLEGCELDSACTNCFFALALSSCGSACSDELNTCAGNQGTGGAGNGGGGAGNTDPGTGGTAGVAGLDKTCADLEACCAGLDANTKPTCDAVVMQGVDLLCGATFSGLACQ